jgi:pyruvate ferredoxin oxidoreductase delta subunit
MPVIDDKKCTASRLNKPTCFLCWLYCPEAVITKGIPPLINLEYCKGCGICLQVCPVQAIVMIHEEKIAD